VGLCIGALLGGILGALSGGLAGHLGYKYTMHMKGSQAEGIQISIWGVISDQVGMFVLGAKERGEKVVEIGLAQVSSLAEKASALACNPHFHSVCIGTISLGIAGGSFGLVVGIMLGGAAGMVPAVLTLGFSIPVGAVLGGVAGASLVGTVCALAGSIAGHLAYKHRFQIKENFASFQSMMVSIVENLPVRIMDGIKAAVSKLKAQALKFMEVVLALIWQLKEKLVAGARNPHVQVICIAATVGAIPLGTAGGAFGLVTGILVGGAVGVLLAVVTFGLSIPVSAALGGAVGMFSGTIFGGTVGAAAGGLAGHFSYTRREQIKSGLVESRRIVVTGAQGVRTQVVSKINCVKREITQFSCKQRARATKLMERGRSSC